MGLHFEVAVQRHCIPTTFAISNAFQQMNALTCFVSIEHPSKGDKNGHVKTRLQEQIFVAIGPMNSFPLKLGEESLDGKNNQVLKELCLWMGTSW